MTEPHALVEQEGHTLVVTMNRPEKRNALSGEMLAIMEEAWDRVNEDAEVRVAPVVDPRSDWFTRRLNVHPGDTLPA